MLERIVKFHEISTRSQEQLNQILTSTSETHDPLTECQEDSTRNEDFISTNDSTRQESSDESSSLPNQESVTTYNCSSCQKQYKREAHLQKHINKSHPAYTSEEPKRQFSCSICFKTFSSISNRNSHIYSHNPENSVKCSECNQGFKSVLYLRKHQKAVHTKVNRSCHICQRQFVTQQRFEYHMKSHEAVKRYQCKHPGCDKSFMQHHHLENHKTTHTGISKHLCFKCGKEFRQDCNLKAHLKTHDAGNVEAFKCSYSGCGKSFRLSSSYRYHQRVHARSSSSSHCCPECGKKFTQRSSLRAHFQIHFHDTNKVSDSFKCIQPDCDRSFHRERLLEYHMSANHGIGEIIARKRSTAMFSCDLCQKSFQLQSLLKRHILTHNEEEQSERKHKCDKCEASFKRPEHLKLHVNSVHLKFKPHKCGHAGCEKSFTQVGDRNVHMKVHTDEKPHSCLMCQKSFRLAKGLRAHEKIHTKTADETLVVDEVVSDATGDVVLVLTDMPQNV